jgi:splicing factor 3B subunit 3
MIIGIQTSGARIIVSDVQESLHICRYNAADSQLSLFADDLFPRYLTCACVLDHDTYAGADKFGNVFIVRLPPNINDRVDEDISGTRILYERGSLNGASHKVCFTLVHVCGCIGWC